MDMKNIDGGNMMIKEIRIPIFDALTPYIYFSRANFCRFS
jgi:hypothetical protein